MNHKQMKKIIYILILMSILNSLGCRFKEERFLEKHDVIFSNTEAFEKFVTNANIKLEKAKEIKVGLADFLKSVRSI